MEKLNRELLPKKKFKSCIWIGAAGGLVLVAVPYLTILLANILSHKNIPFSRLLDPQYGFSLLLVLPLVQGMLSGIIAGSYKVGFKKYAAINISILAIDFITAFILFHEGYICLIMASPFYIIIISIGLAIGHILSRYKSPIILHSSLIPLVLLAVAYDTQYMAPNFADAISDTVTINASPQQVWHYIVQYPENKTQPEYWLWQIGLPAPIQSTATGAFVGSQRQCRFTHDVQFDEQITEYVPNKVLTFKITAQPKDPEILGHFSLDKGQLYLEANPDGTTTVIATSWYRLFVRPAAYFDWWATNIVRNVHFRVLNHIKALAETDNHTQTTMIEP